MAALIFEILITLSSAEKEQVVNLLTDSFEMKDKRGLTQFTSFVEDTRPKKYAVVRLENQEIIGVLSLLNKNIYYSGIQCNVAGLSYMAIRKGYKNPDIRRLLLEGMFNYTHSNSDVLLGIARKKMDGFWYRFGFLGFTNFGKVMVELTHLPSLDQSLYLEDYSDEYLGQLEAYRVQSYSVLSVFFNRSKADWFFINSKQKNSGQKIEIIKDCNGDFVGYIVRDGNIIEELSIASSQMSQMASLLNRTLSVENTFVELRIGINHPFSHFIYHNYTHSISTRFVWNGGHILKIVDLTSFLIKIKPVLQKRLEEVSIDNFDFSIHSVSFKKSENLLQIAIGPEQDNFNISEMLFWQKLIFGVMDVEVLCENLILTKRDLLVLKVMFPFLQLQVPLLDQF